MLCKRDNTPLTRILHDVACRAERQFGTFSALDACNYALNIYDQGDVLSIVTDTGEHGTHVAGITSAQHAETPALNGVAPGAQVRSRCAAPRSAVAWCNGLQVCRTAQTAIAREQPCMSVDAELQTHAAHNKHTCFGAPAVPLRKPWPRMQVVSCKIGDTRLGGMETGPGLVRALGAVLENGCDVINMSYGEPTSTPDAGRFVELAQVRCLTA